MTRALVTAAAASLLAMAGSANAATFSFAFIDTTTYTLLSMGTLTTDDTLNASGGYDLESIAGTVNGATITGVDGSGADLSDNIIYTGAPHVDLGGILFDTSSDVYNIYDIGGVDYLVDLTTGTSAIVGIFGITQIAAPAGVPEPATWAMLCTGFGLAGVTIRSRAKRTATAAV